MGLGQRFWLGEEEEGKRKGGEWGVGGFEAVERGDVELILGIPKGCCRGRQHLHLASSLAGKKGEGGELDRPCCRSLRRTGWSGLIALYLL